MKILISSHCFYPSVGGIEEVTMSLAGEFVRLGHEVIVVTQTTHQEPDQFPYEVVRAPTARRMRSLGRWCDVYWQNNISLRTLWPLLLSGFRKPLFITYQTWITRVDGSIGWRDRMKVWIAKRYRSISISQAVATHLPFPSLIIGNPYRESVFHEDSSIPRDRDIVFVGRLVSAKGVTLLVEAVRRLHQQGLSFSTTIIGDGPELPALQRQTEGLPITFAGILRDHALAAEIRRHRFIAIPSLWEEPFGIVAVEGIACGCVAIASQKGGLAEAVGPCGRVFPNGDVDALTNLLEEFLTGREPIAPYCEKAESHLRRFRLASVAESYLREFGGSGCGG